MRLGIVILIFSLLAGCAAKPAKRDFSAFNAAAPRSILVVPVVNRSLDVDAPNYVLATLPVPIAEKGYYVFPVNTTKFVLEQEGFYEGERIHNESPSALAKLFDADAILYVTILRWDAQYLVLSTTVTVDFEYKLVSRDGTELWKESQSMTYSPSQNSNSGPAWSQILSNAINAALLRAAPNYLPLTKQANEKAFVSGPGAIPDGPYKIGKTK